MTRPLRGLWVVFGALAAYRTLFFPVTVVGNSMRPTLLAGDRLLARRPLRRSRIRTGSIVVVQHERGHGPHRLLIKRVAAIGGEQPPDSSDRVPPRAIYVLGDSAESLDSRQLGPIGVGDIAGVVTVRYWPLSASRWLR